MTRILYERVRAQLNEGGYRHNPFLQLLKDRAGIRRPIEGTLEDFSQILYELTRGDLNRKNDKVAYAVIPNGNRGLLKFPDGSLFSVVKTRGELAPSIIAAPQTLSEDQLLRTREMPLSHLVSESLRIQEAFTRVADEYGREERKLDAEKASEERRILRECSVETALRTIEKAKSGETIMIRGLANIDALAKLGFVPCLVDNPDNWVDAEEVPGMRYRHAKSGIEILLTGREKLRPIEELSRLELYFYVNRNDDEPAAFRRMLAKFRETKKDGTLYLTKEFHEDLISLAKYPEELKGRTKEDLGIVADEVGHVIDRRQEQDKGILPYEAILNKDTQAILDHIVKNKTPAAEIRKALDFCEYTGMIDSEYKAALNRRIKTEIAGPGEAKSFGDILYDKRVKEIVATVLKKLSKEQLTSKAITLAMAPYVNELGFGKLVKIRERVLQLKELVRTQEQ